MLQSRSNKGNVREERAVRALYVIQRVYTGVCLQPSRFNQTQARSRCGAQCERVRVVVREVAIETPGVVVVVVVVGRLFR